MPDISMCKNTRCADRHDCWRFIAPPTPRWQSYSPFAPDASGECQYYWPTTKGPSTREQVAQYAEELDAHGADFVSVDKVLARLRQISR